MTIDDDMDAITFLRSRGYTPTVPPMPAFHWLPPTPDHKPTDDENAALNYLFHEWDYGGVIGIDVDESGNSFQKDIAP